MRLRLFTPLVILAGLGLALAGAIASAPASAVATAAQPSTTAAEPLRCVGWSPFIAGYDPQYGPFPNQATLNSLMGYIVNEAGFHCVLIYGTVRDFDWTYQAARDHGMKAIAVIWLDGDTTANRDLIAQGIQTAKMYPDTIVRLSCGNEVRQRLGAAAAEPIIRDCINQVKAAGVTQPVGTIDIWWDLCNEKWPCQPWAFAKDLDWIGTNIHAWFENQYSGLFPCIPADQAADFTVGRFQAIRSMYPGKEVILTEFGWPAGPNGYTQVNQITGQKCGVASEANQQLVIQQTLIRLNQQGLPAVVFEAFREPYLARSLGPAAAYFGICAGTGPQFCAYPYILHALPPRSYLPAVRGGG
jgi:exo-beta-1,3-glucanase (GH17 family)